MSHGLRNNCFLPSKYDLIQTSNVNIVKQSNSIDSVMPQSNSNRFVYDAGFVTSLDWLNDDGVSKNANTSIKKILK